MDYKHTMSKLHSDLDFPASYLGQSLPHFIIHNGLKQEELQRTFHSQVLIARLLAFRNVIKFL